MFVHVIIVEMLNTNKTYEHKNYALLFATKLYRSLTKYCRSKTTTFIKLN